MGSQKGRDGEMGVQEEFKRRWSLFLERSKLEKPKPGMLWIEVDLNTDGIRLTRGTAGIGFCKQLHYLTSHLMSASLSCGNCGPNYYR